MTKISFLSSAESFIARTVYEKKPIVEKPRLLLPPPLLSPLRCFMGRKRDRQHAKLMHVRPSWKKHIGWEGLGSTTYRLRSATQSHALIPSVRVLYILKLEFSTSGFPS